MQLAGPLFNMGTFFREVDQSSVDVEDLFHMLKQTPIVKEKENAVDFEYKEGKIEIKDIAFKHYSFSRDGKNGEVNDMKENLLF